MEERWKGNAEAGGRRKMGKLRRGRKNEGERRESSGGKTKAILRLSLGSMKYLIRNAKWL